jgi:RNase adaptor protein for sRNA GlmZ degradation
MEAAVALRVETFAYGKGIPWDAREDLDYAHVVDCRGLPNPWKQKGLRELEGTDPRMIAYFMAEAPNKVEELMQQANKAVADGKRRILFGCVHGRHRSVAMAAEFEKRLRVATQNNNESSTV